MSESLRTRIETLAGTPAESIDSGDGREAVAALLEALEAGRVRAAEPDGRGGWRVNAWVKEGILLGFRLGRMTSMAAGPFEFRDKDTFPVRSWSADDGVRVVPGGSAVRRGAYLAPGVVCMPPMYVNVGAYVGEGSMVDSHALVGSCAQVGRRVHLSAAAQIGGVLEPAGALPVVIEDDVFVGGGCGVYEGCLVRRGAVLAAGVVLTRATRIYDLPHERVIVHGSGGAPLEVPERAVVVPGARSINTPFGRAEGLSVQTPLIVKYRDERTDAALALEDALR